MLTTAPASQPWEQGAGSSVPDAWRRGPCQPQPTPSLVDLLLRKTQRKKEVGKIIFLEPALSGFRGVRAGYLNDSNVLAALQELLVLLLCPCSNQGLLAPVWSCLREREQASQNHRLVWIGRDLKDHLV